VVPALSVVLGAALRRQRLEEQLVDMRALERSDVMKTTLLRAVSHDLRSPLTAIRAAVRGVGSETVSQAQRAELADVIGGATDRLSRLVDNLLDLSRLEAGGAEPQPDWCSVEEVVRSSVRDVASAGARFDIVLDRELPLVRADAAQLERAVANLLDNAVRYSGGEPVAVRARADGRRFVLRITDRGPGIAKDDLAHIFEPFYRAKEPDSEGSGLGLAIAKGFVEANGGRLRAESLPDQGASFVLELPLPDPAERADPVARPERAEAAT
jgi:two-component system sensor histidine kinase KdpD